MLGKWFNNWFEKQCRKAWENSKNDGSASSSSTKSVHSKHKNNLSGVDEDVMSDRDLYTIKMQAASGGTVLQVSHYDKNQDEWNIDLFVIDDSKDLGEGIKDILIEYRLKHS